MKSTEQVVKEIESLLQLNNMQIDCNPYDPSMCVVNKDDEFDEFDINEQHFTF